MPSTTRRTSSFNTFLKGLFIAQLCFVVGSFLLTPGYNYSLYTGILLLIIQWMHAGYLGMGQGSGWHQRFFWGVPFYGLVVGILMVILPTLDVDLFVAIVCLLGFGVVIPNILAGYYAFFQDRSFIAWNTDDILDDMDTIS